MLLRHKQVNAGEQTVTEEDIGYAQFMRHYKNGEELGISKPYYIDPEIYGPFLKGE